jgi:ligand-binding sensor domain-containing protein
MKIQFLLLALCLSVGIFIRPESIHGEVQENIHIWQEFKNNPNTSDVAADSTYVWSVYSGGVIRWHKQNHTFQTYTFDSQVTAVEVAVGNNVWVGTQTGLHRFDGANWTRYTTSNGLPINYITSLSTGPQDQLFVGAAGSIVVFNGTQWTPVPPPIVPFDSAISDIALDTQNYMWITTQLGSVYFYNQNTWQRFFLNSISVSAKEVETDTNGNKWFAGVHDGSSMQAAAQLKANGTWISYNQSNGLPNSISDALAIDPSGHVWLGFGGDPGLYRFNGASWSVYNIFNGFYGGAVSAIDSDTAGNIWTSGGIVSRFSNNVWSTYLAGPPVSYTISPSAMYVDPDNSLWMGVYGMGMVEFNGQVWQHYTPAQGLSGNIVNAIVSDLEGNMWFGFSHEEFDTVGDGLARFDGVAWQSYTTADGLADNRISDIAVDEANNIWIAHPYSGITQKSATGWTTFNIADGLLSDRTGSIIAYDGSIWVGHGTSYVSESGISRFDGADWTIYDHSDGLNGTVKDLAIDRNNILLALTDSSVFQFNGTGWADLEVPSLGFSFWRFAIDQSNQIWITGNGGGAIRFDGVQSYPVTPFETGTSALGSYVAANETGSALWFNSSEGVVKSTKFNVTSRVYLPTVIK